MSGRKGRRHEEWRGEKMNIGVKSRKVEQRRGEERLVRLGKEK